MGVQVSLKDIAAGFLSAAAHTANNTLIEDALNKSLDRTASVDNAMEVDFDMGNNKIINLAAGVLNSDAVNVAQMNGAISLAGSGLISSQTETQKGSAAVSRVFTFSGLTYVIGANNLEVFRNGQRLGLGRDYTETSTSSITLTFDPNASDDFDFRTNTATTNSTTTTAAITHASGGTDHNLATYLQGLVLEFDTMAEATASDKLYVGAVLLIKDRANSHWDVVLASGVTPNTYNIVQCTGVGTLALVLRVVEHANVKAFGAVGDDVADDTAAIQAAINYAGTTGNIKSVFAPDGVYRTTSSLLITSAITMYSNAKAGAQNFFTGGANLGGARINFAGTASGGNTDPSSFAIQIDVGTIGAEGFANTQIHHMSIGCQNAAAGGIYVEASVNVDINNNWIFNDKNNYDAATTTGIAIYARNMIVSTIHRNTFFRWGYGIVGDDYFNENKITENDFQRCINDMVAIYGETVFSVRNTISGNNFIGDANYPDNAISIAGATGSNVIIGNTFESIRKNQIVVNDINPLSGATLTSGPTATSVISNIFISGGGGQVNSVCVAFGKCVGGYVAGNEIRNPTVNMIALINTAAATTEKIYVTGGNYTSSLVIATGDATKVVDDSESYRGLPQLVATPSTAGWTNDYQGRLWFNKASSGADKYSFQIWNGLRTSNLKQCQQRTDASQDATPEVRGLSTLFCNASAYTITGLDDGAVGQTVVIYNQNAGNLTIDCTGTNLVSKSGSDLTVVQNGWAKFENINGTLWVEI